MRHKVSLQTAHLLAKQENVFITGELIKLCLIAAAGKKNVMTENKLNTISLSWE